MPAPPSRAQQAARDAAVARNNAAAAVSRGTGGLDRTDRAPSAPSRNTGGGGFGDDRTDRAPSASRDTGRGTQTASRDPQGNVGGRPDGLSGLQDRTQQRKESALRTDRQPSAPQVGQQRVGQAPQIPTPRQNPLSDPSKFQFPRGRNYTFMGNTEKDAPGETDQTAVSRLVDMQKRYGDTFTVTSGFRGPKLNSPKALGGIGGATKSQHLQGKAFDIHTGSTSKEDYARLAQAADAVGFEGLGGYKRGSLHVDLGPRRSWGPAEKEVMAAVRSKAPATTQIASKSPFAPPAAQAATPVTRNVVKPMPKPQKAAALAQARELRKVATVSMLRRDPMEGVVAIAPRKDQSRLPLGTGRMTTPKDQSRIPAGSGEPASPPVRSRSPAPQVQRNVPVSPRSRSPFAPASGVIAAKPQQRVTGPSARAPLPGAPPKAPARAATVQGVRPAVVARNVFNKQPAKAPSKAPASNQLGLSPSALPSLARMAISGVGGLLATLSKPRVPAIMSALNEAASYVRMYARPETVPGLSKWKKGAAVNFPKTARALANREVVKEARKAIAVAKRAVASWQKGTLTKVAAAKALQAAQKATVQVARAPHGLISNELRAKLVARADAEEALPSRVASVEQPSVAPRKTTSVPVRSRAAPVPSRKRDRDGGDRDRGEKKPARRVAQVARARSSENPFLFPIGPSYPAS